jgi:hypothetical protein
MLSTKRTDLTNLNGDWSFVSRRMNEERGWWPNRIGYNARTTEVIINVQRMNGNKDFSLSATALHDAIAAEKAGKALQAYVRFANADGSFVTQDTAQNVWRRLVGTPPIHGRFGDYWWLNELFQAHEAMNPTDMYCPM